MRILSLISILHLLITVGVNAQRIPPRTTSFTKPVAATADVYAKRDLVWLKSRNDFDQTTLTASEIDQEIDRRIKEYDLETAIVTFDVPINIKRLTKPKDKSSYGSYNHNIQEALNDQPAANDEFYFWTYHNIDVAVPTDDYEGQYYVYSIARAIEILRCRYPKAYQKLFIESRVFSTLPPASGTFINRFSKILISFNNNTKAPIAESGTVLGTNEDPKGAFGKYSNLAVISFHKANLLNSINEGSNVLYGKSPDENYVRYLREGIVETLVHEMLHRYIETRRNIDELATTVVSARPNKGGGALPLNILWEEIFINNTSLSYFNKEGGLQTPILYYYRGVLEGNIAALNGLRLAKVSDDMSRLKAFTGRNYVEIMKFNYLD